jgi:A/G-specific adenine glycosylase
MKADIVIDHGAAAFAREALLIWSGQSARIFPWRVTSDPYKILMAEMMLRRTQARQVVNVYNQFVSHYPDISSLDLAPTAEITEVLRPLGLSWRAANFKILAHEIVTQYGGSIPRDRQKLLSLTGIGPYVAEAVRCFAYHEPSTIVDTNTVRVAARYFGFSYNPESRRRSTVIDAVSYLVDQHEPARSNYALLDFAATVCQARKPMHHLCPLAEHCAYYQRLRQSEVDYESPVDAPSSEPCIKKKNDIQEEIS